jgi:hypothetical protein
MTRAAAASASDAQAIPERRSYLGRGHASARGRKTPDRMLQCGCERPHVPVWIALRTILTIDPGWCPRPRSFEGRSGSRASPTAVLAHRPVRRTSANRGPLPSWTKASSLGAGLPWPARDTSFRPDQQRRRVSPPWLVTRVERKPPSAGRAAGCRLLVCTRSSDVGVRETRQ